MDIKEASQRALEYSKSLIEEERAAGARFEEAAPDVLDDREVWLITLSFPSPDAGYRVLINPREFKTFAIDRQSGEVRSVRIKSLA